MSFEVYFIDAAAATIELTDYVPREGWELREQAEEGSVPTSSIPVVDGGMAVDLDGNRAFYVLETDSDDDDNVLFGGYLWNQVVSRGRDDTFEPWGRAWRASTTDQNAFWQRVVMRGSDCDRDAETDVERVEWLLGTSEAAPLGDVTTHVSTASPVNMDAVDYRGQTAGQVMQDCAEAGGKNWWVKLIETGAGRETIVWYGRDSNTTYDSEFALSNYAPDWVDADLLDGSSLVWPVSEDTEVDRDPSRIVCGIYAQYEGGATYRHNTTTHTAYGHRDMVVPMPNVKSKAKAQARADRMLADLGEQDVRITTRVRLPAAKATKIRAGMRVSLRLTHVPDFETPKWCRVLACSVSPVAAGAFYDLGLELVPTGPPDPGDEGGGDFTGSAFAGVLADNEAGDAVAYYSYSGDSPPVGWCEEPTVGPLSYVQSEEPFTQLTTSQPITVRLHVAAGFSGVMGAAGQITITITSSVAGIVGTATYSQSGGFLSHFLDIDEEIHMEAGEVLTFTNDEVDVLTGAWSPLTNPNRTYFRIGRGTHSWCDGDLIWEGA